MTYNTNYIIICILLLFGKGMQAQIFDSIQIVDSLNITNASFELAELNNDGQIDVFIRGIDSTGSQLSYVLSRPMSDDSITAATFQKFNSNLDSLQTGKFVFADVDNDNFLDIVLSGSRNGIPNTQLYYGTDSFEFEDPINISNLNANMIEIADLNSDGYKEILLSGINLGGVPEFQLFNNLLDQLVPVDTLDLIGLVNGSISAFDFNNDAKKDILYHGVDATNIPQTFLYINSDNFEFHQIPSGILGTTNGNLEISEINGDTLADILIHGENEMGERFTKIFQNEGDGFSELPSMLPGISNGQLLFADINADGSSDVVCKGINDAGEIINQVYFNDNLSGFNIAFDTSSLQNIHQQFGHLDCDGNLDAVQSSDSLGFTSVKFLLNNTINDNSGPIRPSEHAAIVLPNKVIIVWDDMFDAVSRPGSLTSDLFVRRIAQDTFVSSPNFLLEGNERMLVKHGNQGYSRSTEINDLTNQGLYQYGIQALDNSYMAKNVFCSEGPGSLNLIATGIFRVCDESQALVDTIKACEGNMITLPSNGIMAYYSTLSGILGIGEDVQYTVAENDIIYFGTMGSLDCADQGIIYIDALEDQEPLNELEDIEICADEFIEIEFTGSYDSLFWTIASTGEQFDIPSIEISTPQDEQVFLEVFSGGCQLFDTMNIDVQLISVNTDPNTYMIQLGESIELNASGADFYLWKPENLIDLNGIPNPVVTPNVTTTFIVEGINDFGCRDTASILVIVNSQNWAPTLFTPNGDGKNDFFRIYGTYFPKDLDFFIYNRTGQLVFQTDNSAAIAGNGWNGTKDGKEQPTGVYFWKINGTSNNGEPLLINGKKTGAVHLVR